HALSFPPVLQSSRPDLVFDPPSLRFRICKPGLAGRRLGAHQEAPRESRAKTGATATAECTDRFDEALGSAGPGAGAFGGRGKMNRVTLLSHREWKGMERKKTSPSWAGRVLIVLRR